MSDKIMCSSCKRSFRPLHFLIKYCETCDKYICSSCWKTDNNSCRCSVCDSVLNDIPDEGIISFINSMHEEHSFLKKNLKFKSIPNYINEKIGFDQVTHLLTIYHCLNDEELSELMKHARCTADRDTILELNNRIKLKDEDRRGSMMYIDSACIPICHFSK